MKANRNYWTVTIVILAALILSTWIENTSAGMVVEEQAEVLSPVEQRMQKKVSVDFRNTSIDDVLRVLAKQADVDIVKSPKVIGEVTVVLTDIPLEEALTNILAAHDYGYITTDNMIRIMPRNDIIDVREKLVDRIYQINYADVIEVEKALKKFLTKQGSLSSNPGTSNIIITDTESKIAAIDAFIDEIDRKTPQILVEARIYDITSKDKLDLGIQWDAGREGTITDPFIDGVFNGTTAEAVTTGTLNFGWLTSNMDIDILLKAEQEQIDAKLLANPRILVLDNESAIIKIITEIPYQELSGASVAAGGGSKTTEFREIGVELAVTPHVTRDNMVRIHLLPKFSVSTGETAQGDVSGQPIVDTREAETTLLIQSGETVVLGGMRKKVVTDLLNKVPLLGDIPLLGELFKFRGQDTVTSELVVFITPIIVEKPVMTPIEKEHLCATDFQPPIEKFTHAEVDRAHEGD